MDLSILIVAYNVQDLVRECLTCVKNSHDLLEKEVIFVDNGSADGTVAMIEKEFPFVRVIKSTVNLGFARANNLAYSNAQGKYILLLNVDAFIGKDTLENTVKFMEDNPGCGALGVRLVDKSGCLQPSARYFPTPRRIFLSNLCLKGIDDLSWDHLSAREVDWVPGCYLLTRKNIIDAIGAFLDEDLFLYYDDVEFCLRLKRKNWKVFFYPETVIHLGGGNSKRVSE